MSEPSSSPPGGGAVPNILTNAGFLQTAAGPDWGRVKIAMFAGDPAQAGRGNWQGYPAEDMLRAAAQQTFNTYFSVSVQTGASRGLAGFERIFAIVLDDVGVKVNLGQAETILGTSPSYVLETSPGNHQAGWFTDIRSRDWALGLMTAIYGALGHSDNLTNLVGYMRLPVGTNWKAKCGPNGFRHRLVAWNPGVRIGTLEWVAIEKRIGGVTPIARAGLSTGRAAMPDPGDIEDDVVLAAFRALGRIQGLGRPTTMGWGYDVDCPWIEQHSDRGHEGATYVPVLGRFHCHHGHCQGKGMDEVRERLDELLRQDQGTIMAALEFDEIDPESIPLPFETSAAGAGDNGEPLDLWTEREIPPWPGGVLPAVLEDTIAELAERDGLDLGALGATLLTAASGAADKRSILRPYGSARWRVRPILWLMLVAESGQRKSAILTHLLERLRGLNADRMRAHAQAMAQWRALPVASRSQLPAPMASPLLAEDATVEKLQEWMAGNPRGLLYLRDELAALFDFGRYSGGAGAAERAFLLETNEGGPATIGRMTRTTVIDNCALAILGATQPERIADFKNLAYDGLLSRFSTVMVQPARSKIGVQPNIRVIDATIDRLLKNGAFDEYSLDGGGEALIRELEQTCEILAERPDAKPGFRGFVRKLHGVAARATLVLHLMDGGIEQAIPEDTVARGRAYALFVYRHADVFYAGLPGSPERIAQAVGSYLLRNPNVRRVTPATLRANIALCRSMTTLKEIQDAMFVLVMANWLKPETNMPFNKVWLVHPALDGMFTERKIAETDRVENVKEAMNQLGRYR